MSKHETNSLYDLVIIGGGIVGFGSAVYAGRFQLKTAVIADKPGGTIMLADEVSNYPGFKKVSGIDLVKKVIEHAKDYDVEVVEGKVSKVEKFSEGCFKVFTGKEYLHAKTIIFATGTKWRALNIPGEKKFTNKGVHYCALCDGILYKGRVVGVVGGSDSAAKEALLLAQYAKKVFIIYKGSKIRPEPVNLKRVLENKKIEIINNTNVKEIKGSKFVGKIVLDREFNGSRELALDGVFVEIGRIPISELAEIIGVKLNKKKEIIIDRESRTSVKGVFAAGDVANTKFKQAITGVAEGVQAVYSAFKLVNENKVICVCSDEE